MTNEEFIEAIMERAEEGKHSEFHFISSWPEYRGGVEAYNALHTMTRRLHKAVNNVFKNYLKHVDSGTSVPEELVAFQKLRNCVNFYEAEKKIFDDMTDEYSAYIHHGHFIDQFVFGAERPTEDLHDFRKGTINLY